MSGSGFLGERGSYSGTLSSCEGVQPHSMMQRPEMWLICPQKHVRYICIFGTENMAVVMPGF